MTNILIAESNKFYRAVLVRVFKIEGYTNIHEASTEQKALSQIEKLNSLDLLVTDNQKRGVNGTQLINEIDQKGYSFSIILHCIFPEKASVNYHGKLVRLCKTKTYPEDVVEKAGELICLPDQNMSLDSESDISSKVSETSIHGFGANFPYSFS